MDKNTCFSIPLIDEMGTLNVRELEIFAKKVKQDNYKYATVSIMGPQSSGKSTLLNHLFDTNFKEMDVFTERGRSTKGIWLEKSTINGHCIFVMDLEGTDGGERQDNVVFERQTALFALAVSDVVLINMWSHDVGREHAANLPLLRVIFQVKNKVYSTHKVNLLFVIRDKPNTLESTLRALRKSIEEVWDESSKPKGHEDAQLNEVFNVEIVALSHYEHQKDDFKMEVGKLREKLVSSVLSGRLAGSVTDLGPASDFGISITKIWNEIKENKVLHLPSHKVMLATFRCEEIASEKLSCFRADEDWLKLLVNLKSLPAKDYRKKLSSILHKYLSEYDANTKYYDEGISYEKKKKLIDDLRNLIMPVYKTMLENVQARTLDKFKTEFDRTLMKGEYFYVAKDNCTKFFMTHFKEQCTDVIVEQVKWNFQEDPTYQIMQTKLRLDIHSHVEETKKQAREKRGRRLRALAEVSGIAAAATGTAGAAVTFAGATGLGVAGVTAAATATVAGAGAAIAGGALVFAVAQLGFQTASAAFKLANHLKNKFSNNR